MTSYRSRLTPQPSPLTRVHPLSRLVRSRFAVRITRYIGAASLSHRPRQSLAHTTDSLRLRNWKFPAAAPGSRVRATNADILWSRPLVADWQCNPNQALRDAATAVTSERATSHGAVGGSGQNANKNEATRTQFGTSRSPRRERRRLRHRRPQQNADKRPDPRSTEHRSETLREFKITNSAGASTPPCDTPSTLHSWVPCVGVRASRGRSRPSWSPPDPER